MSGVDAAGAEKPNREQMARALRPQLKKRTYWRRGDTTSVRETSFDDMVALAGTYNKDGDKFPENPKKEVRILDVDQNVATVKLVADDWIDYMHLMKIEGRWKIINVLWQFHDISIHLPK